MRSIPSWAYNGGARAADSGNGGKYLCGGGNTGGRPDRGQFHYRSGLNMIPLLEWYRAHPEDENFHLLQVAMGSIAGQLTNIDESGATSMMWHAYPWVMVRASTTAALLQLYSSAAHTTNCPPHTTHSRRTSTRTPVTTASAILATR